MLRSAGRNPPVARLGADALAPVPLYTTYQEAWRFAAILREILAAS
jgi:hypothetical protein